MLLTKGLICRECRALENRVSPYPQEVRSVCKSQPLRCFRGALGLCGWRDHCQRPPVLSGPSAPELHLVPCLTSIPTKITEKTVSSTRPSYRPPDPASSLSEATVRRHIQHASLDLDTDASHPELPSDWHELTTVLDARPPVLFHHRRTTETAGTGLPRWIACGCGPVRADYRGRHGRPFFIGMAALVHQQFFRMA